MATAKKKISVVQILLSLSAFFPFVDCASFFYINNRRPNRKWMVLGWFALLLQVLLCMTFVLSLSVENPRMVDSSNEPQVSDYLGRNYWDTYGTDYDKQPEYDEYLDAHEAWEKTPEIQEQKAAYAQFEQTRTIVSVGAIVTGLLVKIVILVLALNALATFRRLETQAQNKMQLTTRLSDLTASSGTIPPQGYAPPSPVPVAAQPTATESPVESPASTDLVNVNTATEETLVSLPGITIIEAKKSISYRDANGDFPTLDAFLDCIGAKPHIAARLSAVLYAAPSQQNFGAVAAPHGNGKRRIDL
ncbi:MAG: ComEA family DNA-binding protein [Candidatus Fimenecus sp.]